MITYEVYKQNYLNTKETITKLLDPSMEEKFTLYTQNSNSFKVFQLIVKLVEEKVKNEPTNVELFNSEIPFPKAFNELTELSYFKKAKALDYLAMVEAIEFNFEEKRKKYVKLNFNNLETFYNKMIKEWNLEEGIRLGLIDEEEEEF